MDVVANAAPLEPRYLDGGRAYASVTQVLRVSGLAPDYSDVPEPILTAAAERGAAVHRHAETMGVRIMAGEEIEPRGLVGHLRGWVCAMRDPRVELVGLEEVYASDSLRVAGRVDCRARLSSHRAVVDWKTTYQDHPEHAYQLALYRLLVAERYPDWREAQTWILYLGSAGGYRWCPHGVSPEDEERVREAAIEWWRQHDANQ